MAVGAVGTGGASPRLDAELLDAVYRAAGAPGAWFDVMSLIRRSFPSSAQTFYFLERERGRLRPVCLDGVERSMLASFEALFFAPDNPWMRVTGSLHRPGVVRTNERLDAFLQTDGALYRSAYYNDWMRPQGFRYTLGNTLIADGDTVANITLMRPPDMPTFDAAEVRRFERLSHHMTRSLTLALALERSDASAGAAAWQQLPHAVALLDRDLRLRAANPAMEALLRRPATLVLRDGRIVARGARAAAALAGRVAMLFNAPVDGRPCDSGPLWLADGAEAAVCVELFMFVRAESVYLPADRLVMLVVREHADPLTAARQLLPSRHGCTPGETRLALALAGGNDLAQAAAAVGLTYESARAALKRLFAKLDVHTQGQVVSRVLRLAVLERDREG